jgi:putative phosphoesterase
MVIGVISDTHDKITTIDKALKAFLSVGVELIIHCGDWKSPETLTYFAEQTQVLNLSVKGVLGNNDLAIANFMSANKLFSHCDIREGIFELSFNNISGAIYHGHHAPTLRKIRESDSYDVVFLGHTHKPRIEESGRTIIINPGSTAFSIPRSKTWLPTVAVFNTNTMKAEILTLV